MIFQLIITVEIFLLILNIFVKENAIHFYTYAHSFSSNCTGLQDHDSTPKQLRAWQKAISNVQS